MFTKQINIEDLMADINFLMSDEIPEEEQMDFIEDHTHPDGYIV
jgi:hypothetical protein